MVAVALGRRTGSGGGVTIRHYYAIHAAYGLATLNRAGVQANTLRRFSCRAERDSWVIQHEDREAIPATSPVVRSLMRAAAIQPGMIPMLDEEGLGYHD